MKIAQRCTKLQGKKFQEMKFKKKKTHSFEIDFCNKKKAKGMVTAGRIE